MFEGITPVAQIIISVSAGISLITILLIVYARGIKAGKTGLAIPGKNINCLPYLTIPAMELEVIIDIVFESLKDIVQLNDSKRLERKMKQVEVKLIEIRGLKEKMFYRKLKEAGVKQDDLTSHEDAQYYIQVINSALYFDNGKDCLKTVLRRSLRECDYAYVEELTIKENKDRYDKYIEEFTMSCLEKWKRVLYYNYKSDIIGRDGESIKRRVTNEDVYDMDFSEEHIKELRGIFRDIFDNARVIDERIENERDHLYEKRKEDIRKVLCLNNGGNNEK